MSRPIAYNASGPLSGSIRGGSVNYTVDSGNRDYTTFASKKWVPSADGIAPIVFVTDSYTQGSTNQTDAYPLFYSCTGTGSAAILYTANRIPNSAGNYTNANDAINDLITARGYFILESNDPYQGDFQNGNLLDLDASKMSSYPQTGTNWYDLSGNDFDFSLVNGPSFQSSGWFNIDGADDAIILTGNSTLKSTNTLVVWLRTTDVIGLLLTGEPLNTGGNYYVAAYYPGQGFYNNNAGSPSYFIDTLATANPATPINYLDGRFHMWEVKELDFSNWTTVWNFFNYQFNYQIAGDVAKIQMFNSSLTSAQSKQLYFGAPIVTDGLVFAVDANNIVSYPKSGTAWYNLTGSANGTLTNGSAFSQENGGVISLDGSDDYINFGTVDFQTSNNITLDIWVNPQTTTPNQYADIFDANHSANGFVLQQDNLTYNYYYFAYWDGSGFQVTSNVYIDPFTWSHIVITKEGNNGKIYKNGQLVISNTFTNPSIQGSNVLNMGRFVAGGRNWQGKYGNFKGYNRTLSASEVLQNYQAEQYRFETPPSIVTSNLTLWLDANNLDSYPGTGTTWYDLSGNNNNGTLKSATQWSNLGWMNYDGNNADTETTVATVEINTNSAQGNTVEQWIYGAALNGNGNMPFTWLDYDFDLWWYNNLFGINNGANLVYGISGANSVLLNNWVHVVAYFPYDWAGSYANAKIWINGVAQSMGIVQGSLVNKSLPSSLNVGIGGGYSGGGDAFNWNGRISQTRIYTRELTTAEVQQNYNATKAQFGL
jgi:hypothetical protein